MIKSGKLSVRSIQLCFLLLFIIPSGSKFLQKHKQRYGKECSIINADTILTAETDNLQFYGMTFKKAEYITDFASKVQNAVFDLEGILKKSDDEVIAELPALKGIGVWTAEMILLFCMQRPNMFSCEVCACYTIIGR